MDQMRLILAALAALLALVFVALWFVKGRQHSSKRRGATLFYASLLLFSALLLWSRAEKDNNEPVTDHTKQSNEKTVASANPEVKSADSLRSPPQNAAAAVTPDPKTEVAEQSAVWSKARVITPSTVKLGDASKVRSLTVSDRRNLPTVSAPASRGSVEDVIESRILHAFDFIEMFFELYGTSAVGPSPASTKPTASIEFVSGSAELSLPSVQYLRELAADFGQRYGAGRLEIRTQTNETVSSPENRLELTQRRAEAVRNVLVGQGFPSDRLVPIGSEKAGQSRVQFVHRPN